MRSTLLLAALCAACAGPVGAATAIPVPPPGAAGPAAPGTLAVTGDGRATAAPDTALVSVGVQAFGKSLARTSAEGNERMQRVLEVLSKAGVPPKDVRTTSYDVAIERAWQDGKPGPITGYRVSTAAEVRVRDLSRLGAVLDGVVAAGSSEVNALRLVKDDPTPEQHRALADAVAKARAKAEVLARAAGVAVGEVVAISESAAGPPIPYQVGTMAMQEARRGAPIAEGELELTAQVSVVFAIR